MGWQNLIVGGVVLGAGVYLALSYARKRRSRTGCSACLAAKEIKGGKGTASRLRSDQR